jgi:hypothetical protein
MCGSAKLNIYGDRLLPTTGVHGGNISSQRVDTLDKSSLRFAEQLCDNRRSPLAIDIGGGNAAHSKRLARLGAEVILIDLTDQSANVTAFNREIGRNAILFFQGDIRAYKFTNLNKQVNLIYSQRMLSCIPYGDLKLLLRLLFDYTAEGARCFLSAGGLDTEVGTEYPHRHLPVNERWSTLSPEMAAKHQIYAPECLYREKELVDIVAESGFFVLQSWKSLFGTPKIIAERK